MKEIVLSNGAVAIVDEQDYEALVAFKWHCLRSGRCEYAYRANKKGGKQSNILMHRHILKPESNQCIDHIDGNGLNNSRSNIRIATHKQNSQNVRKYKPKTSSYKGVSFHTCRGKWRAVIKENGKSRHIGYYATEEAAAIAYDDAARRQFGSDGTYNFPLNGERNSMKNLEN
jgi:hypothetical protein